MEETKDGKGVLNWLRRLGSVFSSAANVGEPARKEYVSVLRIEYSRYRNGPAGLNTVYDSTVIAYVGLTDKASQKAQAWAMGEDRDPRDLYDWLIVCGGGDLHRTDGPARVTQMASNKGRVDEYWEYGRLIRKEVTDDLSRIVGVTVVPQPRQKL